MIDFSRILTHGWECREGEGILGIFRCGEAANTGGGWMQISPPSCQHYTEHIGINDRTGWKHGDKDDKDAKQRFPEVHI